MADKHYVASLTTLPPAFGKKWQLFVITPLADFTSAFDEQNKRLALFGVIAILLQICIIYFLSSVISAPLERLALKVTKIQDLEGDNLPPVQSPIREVSVLSRAIDTLDAAVKSFAAFVPVGLVRQLLDSDQKLVLGGHSRFLTIFFSDLEAFSTMSEEVPSQELLARVSAYLGVVTHAVNTEHGTIDKFIGDGVMAFWGAPALLEDHAQRSCFAALRIREGMKELNAGWEAAGKKPLKVRIGIHSDAVLVGNIGSKERMSYTVMGDGVNIAARLEGINKEYGTRICISHSVFKEAGERLCVRPVDDVIVKGRRSKVPIYELVGAYGIGPEFEPDEATVRLCKLTRTAYNALVAEDYALALSRYQEIAAEYPDDPVARDDGEAVGGDRSLAPRAPADVALSDVRRPQAIAGDRDPAAERVHGGAGPCDPRRTPAACAVRGCWRSAAAAAWSSPCWAAWARSRCAASTSKRMPSPPASRCWASLAMTPKSTRATCGSRWPAGASTSSSPTCRTFRWTISRSPGGCRPGVRAASTAASCSIPSSKACRIISRPTAAPSSRTTPSSTSSVRARSFIGTGLRCIS